MKLDKRDLLLYAVTDRSWLGGETLAAAVEKALQGGATIIQLREKELALQLFLEEARVIKEVCRNYGVPFIVNDNVDVALAADADGGARGAEGHGGRVGCAGSSAPAKSWACPPRRWNRRCWLKKTAPTTWV